MEDITNVITNHGLEIEESSGLPKENLFIKKLNGVSPEVFNMEGETLSVYIFSSTHDLEKGIQKFEEQTATYDLVEYKVYEMHNVLVFCVGKDERVQNELSEALQSLN